MAKKKAKKTILKKRVTGGADEKPARPAVEERPPALTSVAQAPQGKLANVCDECPEGGKIIVPTEGDQLTALRRLDKIGKTANVVVDTRKTVPLWRAPSG